MTCLNPSMHDLAADHPGAPRRRLLALPLGAGTKKLDPLGAGTKKLDPLGAGAKKIGSSGRQSTEYGLLYRWSSV